MLSGGRKVNFNPILYKDKQYAIIKLKMADQERSDFYVVFTMILNQRQVLGKAIWS